MSTATAPKVRRWTRQEYHDLAEAGFLNEDDAVELIDGEIIQMSPQNTPHAVAVRLVRRALQHVFPSDTYMVDEQLPLALAPDSEPEPDVAVIEGQPRDFLDDHPTKAVLVVEVADASLQFDRGKKQALYARHNLTQYWIVNLTDRQLEVYRDPSGPSYAERTMVEEGKTVALRDHTVAVSDLLP